VLFGISSDPATPGTLYGEELLLTNYARIEEGEEF
jgi:hypothetical protein